MEDRDMTQFSSTDSLFREVWQAVRTTALVFLVAFGVCLQAHAQSDSGKVIGTITDQTGAVVSGATLTLTNNENGLVLTAASNDVGEINLPAVPRGVYTAKVSAPGFQSQAQSITVSVTQVQDLLFRLTPGAVTTSIEVTSAAHILIPLDKLIAFDMIPLLSCE